MPDIYHYSDYRKFLHDRLEEKKRENPAISFRMLARQVGYKAPSYLPMLLSGRINMSLDMCLKFCSYMKLTKKRCDYFQNMVLFGNASSHKEQKLYFDKMRSFKEAAVHLIDSAQYRFYEKWYNPAIRALLEFFPLRDEYEVIGKLLIPAITGREVQESFELLKELKMIEKDKDGFYRPADAVISTGYEASGIAINTFLYNTLRLSESALGRFPRDERNFSCLTLGISKNGFNEIRQELREFRRKVLKIAEDDKADRIYQFGFQLFPVSHQYSQRKKK
ncbi:MAG: TIGR02147 family protein [Chitinispirillaceae bacterium]|nr:TIGR02147 family protein [Chitinispirillaceae bacterium]